LYKLWIISPQAVRNDGKDLPFLLFYCAIIVEKLHFLSLQRMQNRTKPNQILISRHCERSAAIQKTPPFSRHCEPLSAAAI
jgi:hypothetical protein